MSKAKYKIVPRPFAGYDVYERRFWWWEDCGPVFREEDDAVKYIKRRANNSPLRQFDAKGEEIADGE